MRSDDVSGAANVLVVTGGAGAMGQACAEAMAASGSVLLADLHEEGLSRVAKSFSEQGISVSTLVCDVSAPDDVAGLASKVESIGNFRALVHTAGISPNMATGPRVLDVDLVGSARVLAALLPLVSAGTAAVCIGSIAGYSDVGGEVNSLLDDPLQPGFIDKVVAELGGNLDSETAYVLAKRGVMRLCERLSKDWGARGGRIVSIAPGLIDTPMGRQELEQQEIVPLMAEITPVKRPGMEPLPGHPRDIAAAAAFLCSDAASFISGCDIRIDGGLVGAGRHMGGPL
jgi:NAD(P)-dependent dehydrogenase (short-subunit alcohol dehydrogenase family)